MVIADTSKIAEHLILLTRYGAPLLESLVAVKNVAGMPSKSNTAPVTPVLKLFKDPSLLVVAKAFAKKFPDTESVNKQSKEYKEFVDAFKEVKEELRPIYQVFSALVDFVENARAVLNACAQLTAVNLDVNPDIAEHFLFLAHYLATSLLTVSKMGKSKKAIAAAVIVLDARTGVVLDSSFSKIADLFVALEKPYQFISEVFAPIGPKITSFLSGLKIEMSLGPLATFEVLRKAGIFGVVGMACADPNLPTVYDTRLRMITHMSMYAQSVLTVLFACPQEVLNDSNAATLLKLAISSGTFTGLANNETFQVQAEFDALIKSNGKLSKLKSIYTDALTRQRQSALKFHKDRRQFISHQLFHLWKLCQDRPALLGPKFAQVLGALTFARDEIVHYFIYADEQASRIVQKGAPKQPFELDVLRLLHVMLNVRRLVRKHERMIRTYTCDLLATTFLGSVTEAFDALDGLGSVPDGVKAVVHDLRTTYTAGSIDNPAAFKAFRLNWARLQVFFSLPETLVPINSIPHITKILNEVAEKCVWIDDFDHVVTDHSDLRQLFQFRGAILAHIDESITDPTPPACEGIMDFVPALAQDFCRNASRPREEVVKASVEFLQDAMSNLSTYVGTLMFRIVQQKVAFERKARLDGIALKTKQATSEPLTSAESALNYATNPCRGLEYEKACLVAALAVFSDAAEIDCEHFTAKTWDYLVQVITRHLEQFVQWAVFDHEVNALKEPPLGDDMSYAIQLPTSILTAYETAFYEIKALMAPLPDFPVEELFTSVLTSQNSETNKSTFSETIPESLFYKPSGKPRKGARTANMAVPFPVSLGNYYAELLTSRALSSGLVMSETMGTLVSPLRSGAGGSTTGGPSGAGPTGTGANAGRDASGTGAAGAMGPELFRPEIYFDAQQLAALARLMGPTGLAFIDTRIVKYITAIGSQLVAQINSLVAAGTVLETSTGSAATTGGIVGAAGVPAAITTNMAKIKALDDFMERLTVMGALMDVRTALYRVLARELDATVRPFYRMVMTCSRAAWMNRDGGGSSKERSSTDDIADATNLYPGTWGPIIAELDRDLDRAFEFMKQLAPGQNSVTVLTAVLATSMCVNTFSDAIAYNVALEASPNNAHSMATAIHAMISRGLPKWDATLQLDSVEESLIAMVCEWLLPVFRAKLTETKELRDRDVESVFLILHRLTRMSGAAGEEWLERYAGVGLVKWVQSNMIRRSAHYRRRRLLGSRGNVFDDDAE
ncbi:hypothetical protein GGF32_004198 [Allomyces javanicus]|nr:hypothetical protein GGF32_004198 [Allomyces javanicus]